MGSSPKSCLSCRKFKNCGPTWSPYSCAARRCALLLCFAHACITLPACLSQVNAELPDDAQRFAIVDKRVRSIVSDFALNRNVLTCCSTRGILVCVYVFLLFIICVASLYRLHSHISQEDLHQTLQVLELCKKSLSDFLNGKRVLFPRFYFVSGANTRVSLICPLQCITRSVFGQNRTFWTLCPLARIPQQS